MSIKPTVQKMNPMAQILPQHGGLTDERLREWVAQVYPDSKVKRLALDFGWTEGTAKRVAAGRATKEQIEAMAQVWGWSFVHHLYETVAGPFRAARLVQDMADVKARIARMEESFLAESLEPAVPDCAADAPVGSEMAHGLCRDMAAAEE